MTTVTLIVDGTHRGGTGFLSSQEPIVAEERNGEEDLRVFSSAFIHTPGLRMETRGIWAAIDLMANRSLGILTALEPIAAVERRRRYRKAAALIRRWMTEDDAYNERVGALVEQELDRDGVRLREDVG